MTITESVNLNSRQVITQKISDKKIKLWWVLLVLRLRFALAFAVQGLVSLIVLAMDDPTPWQTAGEWWIVYATIIDLGCLLAISLFTKKEGIRIRDLISFDKSKWKKDIGLGFLFYVIFAAVSFGSLSLVGYIVYGVFPAPTSITKIHWGV